MVTENETQELTVEGQADFARNAVSMDVELGQIVQSSYNPRQDFDKSYIAELAASIKQIGLLQPLVVRELPSGKYEIVCGECRWRAAKSAKLGTVPVRVMIDLDDRNARIMAQVENVRRRDLNPIEKANGYQALRDLGLQVQEIAERVGEKQPTVSNSLRLLDLPEHVRKIVSKGDLTASHARAMIPYADNAELLEQLVKAATAGLPSKAIETLNFNSLDYAVRQKIEQHMLSLEHYISRFSPEEAGCSGCEHKRKRWCLNRECYTSKQAAADEKREAEKAAALEALGQGGAVDRSQLTYDKDYVWCKAYEGCDEKCAHKRICTDHSSPICLDIKCHKKLEKAAEKVRAVREAEAEAVLIERLKSVLHDETATARMLTLGLFRHLSASTPARTKAFDLLDIEIDRKRAEELFAGYSSSNRMELLGMLLGLGATKLTMLAAAMQAIYDIQGSALRTDAQAHPWYNWLVGQEPAVEPDPFTDDEAEEVTTEPAEPAEIVPQAYKDSDGFVFAVCPGSLTQPYIWWMVTPEGKGGQYGQCSWPTQADAQAALDEYAHGAGFLSPTDMPELPVVKGDTDETTGMDAAAGLATDEVRGPEAEVPTPAPDSESAQEEDTAGGGDSTGVGVCVESSGSKAGLPRDRDGESETRCDGNSGGDTIPAADADSNTSAEAAPARKLSKAAKNLVHAGSVDDCSRAVKGCGDLDALRAALDYEQTHATRKTLVTVMERRIKKLEVKS